MDWHNYISLTPGFFITYFVVGFIVAGSTYDSLYSLFQGWHKKCENSSSVKLEACPVCRKAIFVTFIALIIFWPLVAASKITG